MTTDTRPSILTHNGTFTVQNKLTGEHRTFRVWRQDDDATFAPGKRILSLLTGANNVEDYTGFAFVDDKGINVWRSKRGEDGKRSVWEGYAVMLGAILAGVPATFDVSRYSVQCSTRCRRCNRELTTPESIASGIGPICAGREI